ncbi:MAG: hypothetical protein IIA61_11775 [Candidatus Marinimicrobia bacterium]|nr:hypothetical protein [Candidatus Neomarinimicrobiota bacterium]
MICRKVLLQLFLGEANTRHLEIAIPRLGQKWQSPIQCPETSGLSTGFISYLELQSITTAYEYRISIRASPACRLPGVIAMQMGHGSSGR